MHYSFLSTFLSKEMRTLVLVILCFTVVAAQKLITFGTGRSSQRLYLNEVIVFL